MTMNRKLVLEVTLEKHHRPRLLVPGKPWGGSLRTLRESAAPAHVIIERVAEPTEAEAKEVSRERRPNRRPQGSTQYAEADAPLIAEILARPEGEKLTTAARRLAVLAAGGTMVDVESRAKRLFRAAKAEERRRAGH